MSAGIVNTEIIHIADELVDMIISRNGCRNNFKLIEPIIRKSIHYHIALEELVDMVMSGKIMDSKTQIAVLKLWYLRENAKNK